MQLHEIPNYRGGRVSNDVTGRRAAFFFFSVIFCFHRKFVAPPELFPSAVDADCRSIDVALWQNPIRRFVVLPVPAQSSHNSK